MTQFLKYGGPSFAALATVFALEINVEPLNKNQSQVKHNGVHTHRNRRVCVCVSVYHFVIQ